MINNKYYQKHAIIEHSYTHEMHSYCIDACITL